MSAPVPNNELAVLLLTRSDVASLISISACIDAMEEAFRTHANGGSFGIGMIHGERDHVEWHLKSGGLELPTPVYALKANSASFLNPQRFGLPSIMGAILLFAADRATLLAIMDSTVITIQRTAAATAVAARALARADSCRVTVIGAGRQARAHVIALHEVFPAASFVVSSLNPDHAVALAHELSTREGIPTRSDGDARTVCEDADIIVTCTPAREPVLKSDWIQPGVFVAAVGADSPDKNEIEPALFGRARVITDITAQCAAVGDLHHAVDRGVMSVSDVHATLGEVLAGTKPGRVSDQDIILYDATGSAIQDAAATALVYEAACSEGRGTRMALWS